MKVAGLLLPVLLFGSCTKERERVAEVQEVFSNAPVSIEFEAETELPDISHARIASSGNDLLVYGLTTANKSSLGVSLYDLNLNRIRSTVVPIGQGPGDLSDSCSVFIKDRILYAMDPATNRVSIFDCKSDMKLIRCVKIRNRSIFYGPRVSADLRRIAFSDFIDDSEICKNILFCAGFPDFSGARKLYANESGNRFIRDGKIVLDADPFLDYFFRNDSLIVLDMRQYMIVEFCERRHATKKIKINYGKIRTGDGDRKECIEELRGKKGMESYVLSDYILPTSWLVPLGKGFAVIRRQNYRQTSFSEMTADYFDYNLNLIGKIRVPYFFRCNTLRFPQLNHHYCYNEWLFTVDDTDTNWKIKKWRVDESRI